jgi:hypothetical protein
VLCNGEKWSDAVRASRVIFAMTNRLLSFPPAAVVLATAALATLLGAGCAPGDLSERQAQIDRAPASGSPGMASAASIAFTARVHALPARAAAAPAAPAAHLQSNGGRILQSPKLVQVLYGAGTYLPELAGAPPPNMASAYTEMLATSVFGWLGEYNTTSPDRQFGRGRFLQSTTISPAASRSGATIADASVQAELAAQIQAGVLPSPDDDTVYMIHFPRETTNIDPEGAVSCNAFCGYHGTFRIAGQDVLYAVLPDLAGAACATSCGESSAFDNQTAVASRLLTEMVTDPEIGLTTVVGPPLAWYDGDVDPATGKPRGEIGDLCDDQPGRFTGKDGFAYAIAPAFSNHDNGCLATRLTDPVLSGADLLWRGPGGAVAIWYVNGGASVGQAYPGSRAAPGTDWQVKGIADFDGDGSSDILWRNADGTVMVWLLARGFLIDQGQPGKPGLDWTIQGTGDFDHDGNSDIVWRDTDGTVAIWFMNGTRLANQTWINRFGLDWVIEGVGDFTGDGTTDLLWRHPADGAVAIWLMKDGQIAAETPLGPPGHAGAVQAVGDFDGDGTSDVLWRNLDGSLVLWLITSGELGRQVTVDRPGMDWTFQGVADFDHDHRSDIVWRNVDGRVAIWFMDAGTTTGQADPANPGSAWTIQGAADFD